MLHILPISHDIQFGHHQTLSTRMSNYIREKIEEFEINFIFEEASEDDLASQVNSPLIKQIAEAERIEYLPGELNDLERPLVGIPPVEELVEYITLKQAGFILLAQKTGVFPQHEYSEFRAQMGMYEEIRELLWLEKLKQYREKKILAIIGAGHISFHRSSRGDGFDTLLNREGWEFEILPMDFVSR